MLVLTHSTLVDSIYRHLSVADILSLNLVCSAVYAAVRKWLPAAYNVENHFRRFFDDPLSFRVMQARTGTIVSGSNALQFFERTYYPGSDLDLYVPCRETYAVAKWLQENNYVFTPDEEQLGALENTTTTAFFEEVAQRRVSIHDIRNADFDMGYCWSSVEVVFNFIHTSNPSLKVQMIVTEPQSAPVACILHFHSSTHELRSHCMFASY
ncbi:hypothetical protein M408DRAFT_68065 [Serendipita vermifera MAFF 305830]|uniref:Uncharacterized protein n=1 Tax=Serendipita vermifera MAFF 305830 TaxID=933852 RepID=A0A0C3AXV4_SERVB|nr:hypothetical protein M408DRAFT_68065 [Serendipita vermifera MAFF 305830]